MNRISQHVWSIFSIATTLGSALVIGGVVRHDYRIGVWDAQSLLAYKLSRIGMSAVAVSFLAAFIGVLRERPRAYGGVALILSILSFAFYVL